MCLLISIDYPFRTWEIPLTCPGEMVLQIKKTLLHYRFLLGLGTEDKEFLTGKNVPYYLVYSMA